MEHLTNINVSGVLRSGFSLAEAFGVQYLVQCDGDDGQHPISELVLGDKSVFWRQNP